MLDLGKIRCVGALWGVILKRLASKIIVTPRITVMKILTKVLISIVKKKA